MFVTGMQRIDDIMVQHVASFLKLAEAAALRTTCRLLHDARPIRGVTHLTLSRDMNPLVGAELWRIDTIDVHGIPGVKVMDKLERVSSNVRNFKFTRPITQRCNRLIQPASSLKRIMGRIQSDASDFIKTLVVSAPNLEYMDMCFTNRMAYTLSIVPAHVWPRLREIVIRDEQTKVFIPWRPSLQRVEYTGVCINMADKCSLPELHTLRMVDDYLDCTPQSMPSLRTLQCNVEGNHLGPLVSSLSGDMEELVLAVRRIPSPSASQRAFWRLTKLRKLVVDGFVFGTLDAETWTHMEHLEVILSWRAVEDLCEYIEARGLPKLRRVKIRIFKSVEDSPLSNRIVNALTSLNHLESADVAYFEKTLAGQRPKRKKPYVLRQSKSVLRIDL